MYDWLNPMYAVVQSSMVALNKDFLKAIQEDKPAEITGEDNFRTMQLVYASYESAATGRTISIEEPNFSPL
jgi:predicted dehydrogenase